MRSSWDMDDIYLEYADLVEAGEIDPNIFSEEDYVQDFISSRIDRAMDRLDMER